MGTPSPFKDGVNGVFTFDPPLPPLRLVSSKANQYFFLGGEFCERNGGCFSRTIDFGIVQTPII